MDSQFVDSHRHRHANPASPFVVFVFYEHIPIMLLQNG